VVSDNKAKRRLLEGAPHQPQPPAGIEALVTDIQ